MRRECTSHSLTREIPSPPSRVDAGKVLPNGSIGTDFSRRQAQLRLLLNQYQQAEGTEAFCSALTLTSHIAEQAVASGDIIRIISAYCQMVRLLKVAHG